MNTRMLVLGILHRGDFHPYEIRRRLQAGLVECYIDVDVGTLYYAVRQLEKDQLIETVTQQRVARGGVRTVYKITEKGRAEFRDCLHRALEADGPVSKTLYGALLFLHLADPQVAMAALRQRIARLVDLTAKLQPLRESLAPVLSTGGRHLFEHIEKQRQLDRQWLEKLLADIEANGINDIADPARLGQD